MNQDERSKQFVLQFARHENELFRYVMTLLPSWNDAQDVMQDTATALWQHMDEYDTSRPFLPWACQFAYRQVGNFRSRQRTHRRLFSDVVIEALAHERPGHVSALDAQRAALDSCLKKLRESDRILLQQRYASNTDLGELARATSQTPNSLYKSLQRIRRMLLECVTRSMAEA